MGIDSYWRARPVSMQRIGAMQNLWQLKPSHCWGPFVTAKLSRKAIWTSLLRGPSRMAPLQAVLQTEPIEQIHSQPYLGPLVTVGTLRQNLPVQSGWEGVKTWVVFSDLHVSKRTMQVCCKVLKAVREAAEKLDAGILFLGDFWHERGALPIVPLNAVLEEMQKTKAPTLMLVGNHDQVNLSGLEHGLTPIAAACPNVHIFEQPTLFLDALWLPYRRDNDDVEAAVKAAGPVKAIFGHADVLGAFVNESFQAREGVSTEVFEGTSTFLGHYHKPHTVGKSRVEYVGSPYQVSWGESSQLKHLLVLDGNFQKLHTIPLSIGPRFYQLRSADAHLPEDVRDGDRVRWRLDESAESEAIAASVKSLENAGVEVEVILGAQNTSPRIEDSEQLGAVAFFESYAKTTGMSERARRKGLQVLQEVEGTLQSDPAVSVNIDFGTLELEGYSSFKDKTIYPLGEKGIRIVTGRNEDDAGTDSNGAGKTALVMAALWCLTGQSDPRSMGRGLTNKELVNEESKAARVRVTGQLNGQPFIVERSTKSIKGAKLSFVLGEEDLTGNDDRSTQATLDRMMGCNLLTKIVFHSQAEIAGLLEAGDKSFKEELGKIIDVDVWESAKEFVAKELAGLQGMLMQLQVRDQQDKEYLLQHENKVQEAERAIRKWEAERQDKLFQIEDSLNQAAVELESQLAGIGGILLRLETCLQQEPTLQKPVFQDSSLGASAPPSPEETEATRRAQAAQQALQMLELELQTVQKEVKGANTAASQLQGSFLLMQRQLEGYTSLSGQDKTGVTCDRCLQPINAEHFQKNVSRMQGDVNHVGADFQKSKLVFEDFQRMYNIALERRDKAREEWSVAQHQAQRLEWDRISKADFYQRSAQQEFQQELQRYNDAVRRRREVDDLISRARASSSMYEQRLITSGKRPGGDRPLRHSQSPQREQPNEGLHSLTELLHFATRNIDDAGRSFDLALQAMQQQANEQCKEAGQKIVLEQFIAEVQRNIQKNTESLKQLQPQEGVLKELESAFSRKGIPSYAFEDVLGQLQDRTSQYLEALSSGTTLQLSSSRPAASKGSDQAVIEQITKTIHIRTGTGDLRERSIRQLSGGERRRVALALTLGFAALISDRSRMRSNLLVLDEALQQLDEEGCMRVATLLKSLNQPNILLVAQAGTSFTQVFDNVDSVVKRKGCSYVESA